MFIRRTNNTPVQKEFGLFSNVFTSSNSMTPTGVIPKRMTKNPEATQLEMFNRDGSPAFKANKLEFKRIQPRQSAANGGPLGKTLGNGKIEGLAVTRKLPRPSGIDLASRDFKSLPSAPAKRVSDFKFDNSKKISRIANPPRNPATSPAPSAPAPAHTSRPIPHTSMNTSRSRLVTGVKSARLGNLGGIKGLIRR